MAITSTTISVLNVGTITEGDMVSLRVQWTNVTAGIHTVVITWGDGQTSSGSVASAPPTYDETWTHIYRDNGNYDILVQVILVDDQETAGTALTVVNAAPIISAATATLDNNSGLVNLSYTFTDAGLDDTFTALISWGDSSSTAVTHSTDGSYTAKHTYTSFPSGSTSHRRNVSVKIIDDDGGADTDTLYPAVTYNEQIDDIASGEVSFLGLVRYNESISDIARGIVLANGIPFYSGDADDYGYGLLDAQGSLDHTSVLILERDVLCTQAGSIPFEQLVPPE